mgnify:FL=1|tara:strand:+ start:11809 stop:12027 length:219 start_codon:yes stop_codon:yes gene_type:complete
MIVNEVYKSYPGYQDRADDNSAIKLGDLRKTRLTLKQINKLRKMNDVRSFETANKVKKIQNQYGNAGNTPAL